MYELHNSPCNRRPFCRILTQTYKTYFLSLQAVNMETADEWHFIWKRWSKHMSLPALWK